MKSLPYQVWPDKVEAILILISLTWDFHTHSLPTGLGAPFELRPGS